MELRHLRYFVAIAEERSFTRAAERLWVAQPGLSTQIRRLESELGVQLFERHTRGVDLTSAGELFLERARTALAAADAARSTGHDLQEGLVGSVRLGLVTGAGWPGTSALLGHFGHERPAIELTVVEAYGGTLLRDLREGRLDAMIAPSEFGSAELRRVRLGREPLLVLAGPGHRLAGSGPVAAPELEGQRLVITGHRDGAGYDRLVADSLGALGVTAALERGGPGPAVLAAVAAGHALALTTTPDAAIGGVVARAISPARRIEFALLWRDETPAPALNELIRCAEARAGAPRRMLAAVA
ncbi:MAG TPA: LysR family transcriptional regulator [Thermoleophilaceae bacterium]